MTVLILIVLLGGQSITIPTLNAMRCHSDAKWIAMAAPSFSKFRFAQSSAFRGCRRAQAPSGN